MPYPIDGFLKDKNGEVIPVLRHDYAGVSNGVGATVITLALASTAVGVCPSSLYRIVGNTDLFFKYGPAGTVAVTDGANTFLPSNFPELILTTVGQTVFAAASPFAAGGKVYIQRMV